MKYITKNYNNVPVTLIKTDKFKSVSLTLYFKSLVTKENVTLRSVLRKILLESCNKYNTSEKLYINTLENYDAYYSSASSRIGNYIINSFKVTSLIDKYTEPGNMKRVIDTFCEIVFNPFIKDNKFDKETFDIIIKSKRSELKEIKEESSSYAEYLTYKSMDKAKPYTYLPEIKYLDKITPESLYEEYLKMINESEIELVVCGNIDDACISMITNNIKNNKKYDNDLIIKNDDEVSEIKKYENDGYGTQSILNIILYLKSLNDYERNYVIPIYKTILGGGVSSRLFNIIREENSLAYYSFARYEKDDSLINIIMGIEKENYDKAFNLSLDIIDNMKIVTSKEVEEAKKNLITSLLESQDAIGNVVSRKYNSNLFNMPDIDEYINKLNNVTKEEVENITSKIKPSMSHFLKGEKSNG